MQTTILVLHILVCVVLIILVLLQAGREGMGVIFGGGGNSSVFGSQGAGGILSKLTAFLATLFIITSLGYNIMFSSNSDKNKSVLDVQFENVGTPPAPVTPPTTQTEPILQNTESTTSLPEAKPEISPEPIPEKTPETNTETSAETTASDTPKVQPTESETPTTSQE